MKHALVWGLVSAVAVTVLEALVKFDPYTITDWKVWAVGIGAAAVRSGAQAVLTAILERRYDVTTPEVRSALEE